jgi:hypothetical protein
MGALGLMGCLFGGGRLNSAWLRGGLLRSQTPQRLTRQLVEAGIAAAFDMGAELIAHALGPEFRDVIGDPGDGVLALWLRAKEVADVIRHLHQVLRRAVSFATVFGAGCIFAGDRIIAHGTIHPIWQRT